jgi:enoyl-CoA hydratase
VVGHNGISNAIGIEETAGAVVLTFFSTILSVDVLEELAATCTRLAEDDRPDPLVLRSAHPHVFLAGAHLGEIAELDEDTSVPYARLGRETIQRIERFPAPTVAAVDGSCSGGGFDLVLACDAMVTGTNARFHHPGVRRGVITGWSGTTRLPSAAGPAVARAVLLETRQLDAVPLSARGAVHSITGDPQPTAIELAHRLASLDGSRLRLWRALRGPNFIDRFHASVVHKL